MEIDTRLTFFVSGIHCIHSSPLFFFQQANAVMAKWRKQSFGEKGSFPAKMTNIPTAVKQFMNQQNITVNLVGDEDSSFKKPSVTSEKLPKENSPLSLFESTAKNVIARPNSAAVNNEIQGALLKSALPIFPEAVLKLPNEKLSQVPQPQKTMLISMAGANKALLPITSSAAAVEATNGNAMLSSILNGQKDKSLEKSKALASLLNGNKDQLLEKPPQLLTGEELAAEEFMASLANPLFKQMPVDKSLVAALNSMAGVSANILSSGKKKNVLPSIQKRKRSLRERGKVSTFKLTRRMNAHGISHRKRDANESKTRSDKPIERSNMVLPLTSNQQGPKLLDQIRDMGQVIATP